MKVLHLCYEYPPVGAGGGEACQEIATRTAQAGVQTVVLTAWHRGLPKLEEKPNLQIRRLRCFRRSRYQCSVPEMAAFLAVSTAVALYYQLRLRFNLVHVHFAVPSGPSGYVLNRILCVPYVMTLQGGDVPSFIPEQTAMLFTVLKPFTLPVWRRARARVAVSPSLAELAERDYPGLVVEHVPNGVADSFFQPDHTRSPKPVQLLFAGRLAVQKRLDILIEAASQLPRDGSWKLNIVGDGPQRKKLEDLANQHDLREEVAFFGWLKRTELLAVFRRSHAYVLPSSKEGLPLAALQAMAGGVPLIGADVPGIRELVEPGINGHLFDGGNAESLANCLLALLETPHSLPRLGKAAAQTASAYRWGAICKQYLEIYDHAVAG